MTFVLKVVVRGIVFKMARDVLIREEPATFLYGSTRSSYEWANKAAGHELKGALSWHRFFSVGLHVPMQALVRATAYVLIIC